MPKVKRWAIPLGAALITSSLAIVINLATQWVHDIWAWLGAGALTLASGLWSMLSGDRSDSKPSQQLVSGENSTNLQAGGDITISRDSDNKGKD